MSCNPSKVVIALSGGVDSSVSCLLLKEQGFEVEAVTAKMFDGEYCDAIVQNAENLAKILGIKHHIVDLSRDFKKVIVKYFEEGYKNGETPNPCVVCNKTMKWGRLMDYALNDLGADFFATGHYTVKKEENLNGKTRCKLFCAEDSAKDQLYFLFSLSQEQIAKTLFPLGGYRKNEVKEIAESRNLPCKTLKESQGICFLHNIPVKDYLREKLSVKPGEIRDIETGKVLAHHEGHWLYTVGQRKGIQIAHECPLYVINIDAERNIVYVGKENLLYSSNLQIKDVNLFYSPKDLEFEALVKIRCHSPFQRAAVKLAEDFSSASINFYEPVRGIAKGQFAVIYDPGDKFLIGGGKII